MHIPWWVYLLAIGVPPFGLLWILVLHLIVYYRYEKPLLDRRDGRDEPL
jgi:hypothetical protein